MPVKRYLNFFTYERTFFVQLQDGNMHWGLGAHTFYQYAKGTGGEFNSRRRYYQVSKRPQPLTITAGSLCYFKFANNFKKIVKDRNIVTMPCHVLHSAHNINFLRTLATDLQSISPDVTFGRTTAQSASLFHVPDQAELLIEHRPLYQR